MYVVSRNEAWFNLGWQPQDCPEQPVVSKPVLSVVERVEPSRMDSKFIPKGQDIKCSKSKLSPQDALRQKQKLHISRFGLFGFLVIRI